MYKQAARSLAHRKAKRTLLSYYGRSKERQGRNVRAKKRKARRTYAPPVITVEYDDAGQRIASSMGPVVRTPKRQTQREHTI
jgi:hypothetical protein